MMSRRFLIRAFTLVEMMVSMAVLVLLVLLVAQIMNGATKTTGSSRQRLDADSEARMVFDRMATDFAGMVNRKDVDFIFRRDRNGNGAAYFFSMAPAVNSGGTLANLDSTALIGYRINSKYQIERFAKSLEWNQPAPGGMVFLSYLQPLVAGSPTPTPQPGSTLTDSAFGSLIAEGSTDKAYHVLGENVFRLEFSFLLKPFVQAGVLQPAVYSDKPFNATRTTSTSPYTNSGVNSGVGLTDVQAIVVTIALVDGKSHNLVTNPSQFSNAVSAFSANAASGELPAAKWQDNISSLSGGLPQIVASQVRVYQRVFFLNSGAN
jgi:prepilin-type N-terminal cleavage/methylation domain-containing protein